MFAKKRLSRLLIVASAASVFVMLIVFVGLNRDTRALARTAPQLVAKAEQVDAIIIHKAERVMTLLKNGKEVARYTIRLGFTPEGQKVREGDGKTPEGVYHIDRRNAQSRYHLSLGLNYPNKAQRKAARAKGINPGGDIFIHGQPNAVRGLGLPAIPYDWTDGCVAVSNGEIEEIFARIPIGTKVTVLP